MAFRALEAALNAVWAMEPSALETLLTIAAREHEVTPEALEAYEAKAHARAEQATVRNGVGIIAANGPMFKRANLMTALSGATSYETMARDLSALRDDPKVKAAILNLDTPGGEASGAGELATMIRAFAQVKPIVAYVNGSGASAGYWLAAACTEIVVDPQAILGSIGVQMAMQVRDEPKGVTTHRFISSQSPMKNADPASEAGAAHIQSVVDAMASVFVSAVADYRGVATETVLSDFGKGGIFVGKDAVAAGLADRVGNFEGVLAELSKGRPVSRSKGAKMSDESTFTAAERDAAIDAAVAKAVAASNARVAALTEIGANLGASQVDISAAITASTDPAVFALEQSRKTAAARTAAVDAEAAASAARIEALKGDEAAASKADPSKGVEPVVEPTAEAIAARIAAA